MTPGARWAREAIGHQFRDPQLLELALTHRSATGPHNERLEFLGDAVLGLVVAERLYAIRPDAPEGTLSRLRARVVRQESLEEIARQLGLGAHLRLGPGELRSGGHLRSSILANSLEAVFGAVFLDGGWEAARRVVAGVVGGRLEALPTDEDLRDPKTSLQELMQARGLPLPVYRVAQVTGSPHDQTFEVVCTLEPLGLSVRGVGTSRRGAEQQAAARALLELGHGA